MKFRRCQSTCDRPPSIQAGPKHTLRPSFFACPLSDIQRLSFKGNEPVSSLVVHLLGICRPAAVVRRVSTMVLAALNRMPWGWLWPHICEKIREGMTPPFTDRDAPPAVVLERLMLWVSCPLEHLSPASIFRCTFTVPGRAMCSIAVQDSPPPGVLKKCVATSEVLGFGCPLATRAV